MKKIAVFLLGIIILTGCEKANFEENYDNMTIGSNVESYQLDLRIYGKVDNEKINKIIKVDNYKNEQFKIDDSENTYYITNGKTYKEVKIEEQVSYEVVNETLFTNTDILLQGLKNIESKKEIDNDITGKELKAYNVELKENYVKELLTKLGYNNEYQDVTGTIYLDGENVYKVIYKVDDLTINGTFFRMNSIKELKIDFENILSNKTEE